MRKADDLLDDAALDALFASVRANPPLPSAAVMTRLCDAALAAQPVQRPDLPARPANRDARRAAPWRRAMAPLLEAIGGWPALAGLATAGVAGLWIGFNPPQALTVWTGPGDLTMLAPYDLSLLDEEG